MSFSPRSGSGATDLAGGEPSRTAPERIPAERRTGGGRTEHVFTLEIDKLDREFRILGLRTLCELVDADPIPMPMKCRGCGVLSLVPDGIARSYGHSFLAVWIEQHARCGRGKVK